MCVCMCVCVCVCVCPRLACIPTALSHWYNAIAEDKEKCVSQTYHCGLECDKVKVWVKC